MGRIVLFAVSKRHIYQRIDVNSVEMMSVACQTLNSDVDLIWTRLNYLIRFKLFNWPLQLLQSKTTTASCIHLMVVLIVCCCDVTQQWLIIAKLKSSAQDCYA